MNLFQSLGFRVYMHKRASEILCIRFDCTQINHFVDYVMSRFGRQGSAFVTDDFDLHCPIKTLALVQDLPLRGGYPVPGLALCRDYLEANNSAGCRIGAKCNAGS